MCGKVIEWYSEIFSKNDQGIEFNLLTASEREEIIFKIEICIF